MKKIVFLFLCLIVVLWLYAFPAIGQTRSKRTKHPVVKKVDPLIAEAEKDWPQFWQSFRKAVLSHDHASLRKVMADNFNCGFGDEIKDQRDACLKDWKKSSESNQTYDDWSDLIYIVTTGKDAVKIRKEKNFEDGSLEVFRTISPRGEMGGSMNFLSFVFRSHGWKWTNLGIVYD